jgi:very-short-patch-repair endonuclease
LLVRQHGTVTRKQCVAQGLSHRQIDLLLTKGLLVVVFRGVFRDPASPVTVEQRALTSTFAGRDGAVASHRMALALWGMRNYRCELREITARRKVVQPGLLAHRSTLPFKIQVVRSVPVTSPARTLLDCASVVDHSLIARFAETWLSTGVVTLSMLERELKVSNGHHGVGGLAMALSSRTLGRDECDSPAEAALGRLLMKHLLPRPVSHYLVTVSSGAVFELDWSFPERRLAFELDGYGVHLRSLEAFEHDRFRRNELEIDGWTILNFTTRQVERHQAKVLDQVRRLLGRRVR